VAQAPRPDAALRRVFDEHHDAVHRYCLRRLDVEDANEATAEVFVVAWRRVDSIPDGPGALPWLYGVARNVVRNQRRSRRRSVRLASLLSSMAEVPPEQPEAQVVRHSEVVEMHDALGRLRPQDRELLRLKTWEELSNKEIGEILGMSVRAVEGRYARLLKKLAKALPGGLGSMPQLAEEAGEL
jgi:RNA polymerase sigma-70 factor (ECF subfamily)